MIHGIDYLKPRDFDLGEEWEDIYLEIKNIRKGDVFFECERGVNYKLTALTSARRINDGWYCIVRTMIGDEVEIFLSDMTSHPGPNFFKEPQFVTQHKEAFVYVLD